mmetsp:Transcript_35449/g.75558  ORF Transcript_35449/g.75558 Transcript_35449/m.75558 type:complete len:212 (-) Transcript_35449:703-1338(-)|eukprot:CAMPEP_0206554276 /NCGR_PEP_ID=MMETSP0325_2-20121206/17093_1 /ASSEMBLY_ACC=CAM_ASM_000347 /TAXON_ID=2866 /ORGANISM="Crypthecodinium cohnii, Strain Seligo" /LENGTH=211 /DNA_ID=CAMNT_0054054337 /DNA_START=152 /DNA_END=787 /DNA_ORIENTATION=+
MCWARPDQAQKSCSAAALAARAELNRLKALRTASNIGPRYTRTPSSERNRLKSLVHNLQTEREVNVEAVEDPPTSSIGSFELVDAAGDVLLGDTSRESSMCESRSTGQDGLSASSASGSGLPSGDTDNEEGTHSGKPGRRRARRSGRARQREARYWQRVRARTPSPEVGRPMMSAGPSALIGVGVETSYEFPVIECDRPFCQCSGCTGPRF